MIAVAIGADQVGAIGRLAASGQATPTRRALGEALVTRPERLFQNDTVLRLCRAAVGGRTPLECLDEALVELSDSQLRHTNESLRGVCLRYEGILQALQHGRGFAGHLAASIQSPAGDAPWYCLNG